MKLMTYDQYLVLGREAYQRVQNHLSKGRGNKTFGDEPGGWLGNADRNRCVEDLRAAADKELSLMSVPTDRYIATYANYALSYKCGNCEEFSALTFQMLKTNGVRPLDWMKQLGYGNTSWGNHAFVIIGRDDSTTAGDIASWNKEVVWCDPYEKKIGGIKEIKERFEGKKIILRYRWA
jgi:hypothetical protein